MAKAACAAGADAIGLMFYAPSPRHLEIEQAVEIRHAIPPFCVSVAVMVNPAAEYVKAIIDQTGVDRLQFHGEESEAFCSSFGLPWIKVIRVADDTDVIASAAQHTGAAALMLETHVPGMYGGTGERFDWKRARIDLDKPVILAGGLEPGNVAQAITEAAPYGVDVSSGVETDGAKDLSKIIDFCRAVRAVQTT